MANTKKPEGERKKPISFSIKSKVLDAFLGICSKNGLNPSHEGEKMMIEYIKRFKL